ncbi:hypothetical protein GYMLUDRAFT_246838 [Collybiopsis luxurians FD-317 M1]|uniref:Uncharacterized protein n=1 Tax=Collybiopsis luxurians FD-317 M1 TaxID=944289 RepID=A0A0D0BQR2_9AGAR|nr:hypothetical protein GYMLUDRAFT_246838 [Collybiopsis luxurians FD-317 M1]
MDQEVDMSTGGYLEDIRELGKLKKLELSTGRNSKAWKSWKKQQDKAALTIVYGLHTDQNIHIKGIDDSPLAMFKTLTQYHLIKGLRSVVSTYKHIMTSPKDDMTPLTTHIESIQKLTDLLESLSEPITNSFIAACIFVTLPITYSPVISVDPG